MNGLILRNGRIFDGWSEDYLEDRDVVVEDGQICDLSKGTNSAVLEVIDLGGRTVMPGLIDAHVHTCMYTIDPRAFVRAHPTYLAARSAVFLRQALDRGFTTVRDVGGADVGLALAVRERLIPSPRLFYAGRILSQTGGHADLREAEDAQAVHCCGCATSSVFHQVVDGVDAMRAAVREELRKGAHHIKIMASGGITSPTDPLDTAQFSEAEISVCVEEADRRGAYVAAHCHSGAAAVRCAKLGVRSIEHGTMLDEAGAKAIAKAGSFVVPTISVIHALLEEGPAISLSAASVKKLATVAEHAFVGLEAMRAAKVKVGFGTDLPGSHLHKWGTEFTLRGRVFSPIEVLRSATSINADLLRMGGHLGVIKPGAAADLIVVDGDVLSDLSVLASAPESVKLVIVDGEIQKRTM